MRHSLDSEVLPALESDVRVLRLALLAAEAAHADEISAVHPSHRRSAANLVHYVEMRKHDVRDLQDRLGLLGLSTLGRSEPHVLGTIEAVLDILARMNGHEPPESAAGIALPAGHEILAGNADDLLGRPPEGRPTRIMVTLPTEAACDAHFAEELVARGMGVARINCAHDDEHHWARMIAFVRSSIGPDGHHCRVAMDLGGPKLRTGPLVPGPRAARVAPRRDPLGRVVEPAFVWLTACASRAPKHRGVGSTITLPVISERFIRNRSAGDRIELEDTRGAIRVWPVVDARSDGCLVEVDHTTYVASGVRLISATDDGYDTTEIGELPEVEQAHRVCVGDTVVLTRSMAPNHPTAEGSPHYIGCTLREAFDSARPGERVWLDDGKLGGTIKVVSPDEIELTITDAKPRGANLKAGKGINLPDSDLSLDALTPKDLDDLKFVARNADLVSLSFVRRPEDVERLQAELQRLDAGHLGIVLKIENVMGFNNLPALLLVAMRSPHVGVMIARGDLAVEVGFDRLAEVQEEILWACEAAHVPVIWATQVLDTLARTGQPSRAEVTDAAMGVRAECVMLNKGPHIAGAVTALDSILRRMHDHQDKKRTLLRRLRAWDTPPSAVGE